MQAELFFRYEKKSEICRNDNCCTIIYYFFNFQLKKSHRDFAIWIKFKKEERKSQLTVMRKTAQQI